MRFTSRKPTGFLADFVENFWMYEGYDGEHSNERILPTGTFELVVNLREDELRIYDPQSPMHCDRFTGAVVSGAYRQGFLSDAEEEAFIVGVHFKPAGAFPFLGFPAHEFADSHVDLGTLWGRSGHRLRERLCEGATAEERFDLLEDALNDHVLGSPEHHYAVDAALSFLQRLNSPGISEIADELGLSHRRFAELFKREVGMTPKLFARVQRFQLTRAMIHRFDERVDWCSVAADCGYFDQSHLIRDFEEFSGLSPATYLRRYLGFLEDQAHIKSYHLPLNAKVGQFYPIQKATGDDIVNLGGEYVDK